MTSLFYVDVSVMTIIAKDYDEGANAKVTYLITPGTQEPSPAFKINNATGVVVTTVGDLDREKNPVYTFQVVAMDAGTPPLSATATATVNIKDINDNNPVFEKKIYSETIPETQEGLILTIRANDLDIDDTLTYSLIGANDRTHFQITVDGRDGRLEVYTVNEQILFQFDLKCIPASYILINPSFLQKPDYENPSQRFFNLTAEVSDGLNTDIAYIEITIQDVNDEVPIIIPQNVEISRQEDLSVGEILAKFRATDRDQGINGQFE